MKRIPLIYVAGAGHSGSTMLEMLVSGAERHVGLGEIFQLVDRRNIIIDNLDPHLCSCGAQVEECSYWRPIIQGLRGIPRGDECARYAYLGDTFRERFGDGAVLVDSSKLACGLDAASRSGRFDIRVLHLVRDVRSYLVSMQRSYARNGVDTWKQNRKRSGLMKGTVKYLMRNALVDASRWKRVNSDVESTTEAHNLSALRVSYERLCFDTKVAQAEIEEFLGSTIPPYGEFGARADNHSIFGNRMRFDVGKTREIRYDSTWLSDNAWLVPYAVSPSLRRMNWRLGRPGS